MGQKDKPTFKRVENGLSIFELKVESWHFSLENFFIPWMKRVG